MSSLLNDINGYWAKRAQSYSDGISKCLKDKEKEVWIDVILENFPNTHDKNLRVLDIGTGPGFFAISLAMRGYNVVAVDYTREMLEQAKLNGKDYIDKIDFLQMDAHCLEFEDESFDIIVTRNLTWNLERPVKAYKDWYRVLKVGGRLINFDANWYGYLYTGEENEDTQVIANEEYYDYHHYPESDVMEEISRHLPLSKYKRPQWDCVTLLNCGFRSIYVDTDIYKRTWTDDERRLYGSSPGFMIRAEK